jgi:hypothetical protein
MNPAIQGPQHQKRRYTRVRHIHGGSFIDEPPVAEQFVSESENPDEYELEDVWMSPAEVEALPEFDGF